MQEKKPLKEDFEKNYKSLRTLFDMEEKIINPLYGIKDAR